MRQFLLLITTLFSVTSYGQNFSYPSIKQNGKNINQFIPANWTLMRIVYGDLNKDSLADAALILEYKDSVQTVNYLEDTVLSQPRMLLILFKNASGNGYQLGAQSNSFILKDDNPRIEDPFQDLAINKGVLEIKFMLFSKWGTFWVTNASYKFRFQNKEFVLIGVDKFSSHRSNHDFEEYSYNFLTKKRILKKGNDTEETEKSTTKPIKIPVLKTLKTFKEPFTWEVEKNIYL